MVCTQTAADIEACLAIDIERHADNLALRPGEHLSLPLSAIRSGLDLFAAFSRGDRCARQHQWRRHQEGR